METYNIIDEPKPKGLTQLIFDPIGILFACILIPIFWTPPLMGKFWMPILWMLANGIFLGSPTLKKEVFSAIFGGLVLLALFFSFGVFATTSEIAKQIGPYIFILMNATLFLTLYYMAFCQASPYALHQYLKQQGQ